MAGAFWNPKITGKGASTAYVSLRGKTTSSSPVAGNETRSPDEDCARVLYRLMVELQTRRRGNKPRMVTGKGAVLYERMRYCEVQMSRHQEMRHNLAAGELKFNSSRLRTSVG